MELLLPVALVLFPNLLPSTYTTAKKAQENMKRKLRARVEMAAFMQDVMEDAAKEIKTRKDSALHAKAEDLLQIVEKARAGHPMSNDNVLKIAKLFKDDITLDTMSRPQLVTLCRFVGITVFGTPSGVMRMQLRAHLRSIKSDDRMIMWEGIGALNSQELQQACQDRGMRGTGLSDYVLRMQLQQWLELSVRQDLPLAFLILSRTMAITASTDRLEKLLGGAISKMDDKVVKEAVRVSSVDGMADPSIKLETLQNETELIEEDKLSKEKAAKKPLAQTSEEEEELHKLSVEELEALSVLASESAVEQERDEIQKIKEELEELEEEAPAGWGPSSEAQMRDRLKKMLAQLEEEADKVDESIGDDLFMIDKDKDGVMSSDEMRVRQSSCLWTCLQRTHSCPRMCIFSVVCVCGCKNT